jgi:flagellar export protein FliJ
MGFEFSLATLLRFRRIIEEREEQVLQKILFELNETSGAIARTDDRLVECYASRGASVLKPSIGLDLQASYGEVKELQQRRKELEARMHKIKDARNAQMIVYEAARRNREMLTDMREKKRRAYDAELEKRRQKALDDNFAARRSRSS